MADGPAEASEYFPTKLWVARIAAFNFVVFVLLGLLAGSVVLGVAFGVFIVILVMISAALKLAPGGMAAGMTRLSWDETELREGWFGPAIRSSKTRFPRGSFPLRMYDEQWRTGDLGNDLRRWAPHLLE